MSIEDNLRELIISRYKSVRIFSQESNLPYGTIDSILRRGVINSSLSNVLKLCNELGISADELGEGRIVPIGEVIQNKSKLTDIEQIIEFTKSNIKTYSDLTIDGKPLTENEMNVLCDGLDLVVGLIKRNRERNDKV